MAAAASSTELLLGTSDGLAGSGPLTPRLSRQSLTAALEYRLDPTWTVAGALGASLAGNLDLGGQDVHDLAPGFIAVVGASRALADTEPYFAVMGMSVGISSVATLSRDKQTHGQLTAGDVRLNITAGRFFVNAIAPYAALRLFGGPIVWQRDDQPFAGGTDRYHVQAGVGLLVSATSGFDGFVELAPVGERALTVGIGTSF